MAFDLPGMAIYRAAFRIAVDAVHDICAFYGSRGWIVFFPYFLLFLLRTTTSRVIRACLFTRLDN